MATALHLTLDPWWDRLTAIAFGRVDDGLPPAQCPALDEEPRIELILDRLLAGPVIGVRVVEPHEIDVARLTADVLWSGPRFAVPALALADAAVGEILLAVQGRYDEGEATADAIHLHLAIEAGGEGDLEAAERPFRLAVEAGDMKAMYGLGYTLVNAGRPREAYDVLRRYAELTPYNAWAWCWLGRACAEMGATEEARRALEWALAAEEEGLPATDARQLLGRLGP